MSIIRNTASGLQKGRVGNTTYYVMNGQQVARQARNNSNYGETASRSYAQQARRVKWSNLVNLYKACKSWMPKAFENKKRSQSDYNKFMSVNINSSRVSLTKDEALNGAAVLEPIIMSQGSLPQIQYAFREDTQILVSDIKISVTLLPSTHIAVLAADIIANNPGWSAGDNLALILFANSVTENGYTYVRSEYYEFTLDTTTSEQWSSLPISAFVTKDATTGCLSFDRSAHTIYGACMLIHTRKQSNMLLTSTQRPALYITYIYDAYSTQEQLDKAIASYGVSDDVPLDPSFSQGSIVSVSVNGVVNPSINGSIVEVAGAVELVINGQGVNSKNLWLEHDGVRYTPLQIDGNSWLYILASNGTNRIYINGNLYGGVEIVGISQPSELTGRVVMYQESDAEVFSPSANMKLVDNYVLNYPFKATSSLKAFLLRFAVVNSEDISESDMIYHNCTASAFSESSIANTMQVFVVPNDNEPCWVSYKGYIIAVFNYEQ